MDDRYRRALEAAMFDVTSDPEVVGVVFTGSVQQGRPHETSDLDLYVVTHKDHYWRATRIYEDVTTELFFNSVASMKWRITRPDEFKAAAGFATGEILLDRTGETAELQQIARRRWDGGPAVPTEEQVTLWRYTLNDLTEDLEDVAGDPVTSRVQGAALVAQAMEIYCRLNRYWGDKSKRLVAYITERDRQLGQMLAGYYQNGMNPAQALQIVDYVLAPVGGRLRLWESNKVTYQGGV